MVSMGDLRQRTAQLTGYRLSYYICIYKRRILALPPPSSSFFVSPSCAK